MISEQDTALMQRCLDAYYQSCPQILPGPPIEMLVSEADQDEEWRKWRPIPSSFTLVDVARLEENLPAKLPSLFKTYLTTYHILDMDFGEYHLPPLPSNKSQVLRQA